MVNRAYLLEKPSGPSASKIFFDQQVIPVFIDAAGSVEGMLERMAMSVRRRPIEALGAALGIGTLATLLTVPARA